MLLRRPTSEGSGRRLAGTGIGAVLVLAVVTTVLLVDPARDRQSAPPGSQEESTLTSGRELCDAYVAMTRASDQFLAEGTPPTGRALDRAVADLVPVAARTELSAEERAGLAIVVDGLASAAGLPAPDLGAGSDTDDVSFAAATTAFGAYLSRSCEAQLGPAPAPR